MIPRLLNAMSLSLLSIELPTSRLVSRRLRQRQCLYAEKRLELGLVPEDFGERVLSLFARDEQVAMAKLAARARSTPPMFGTRYASATDESTPAADGDPRISAPSDTTVSSMSASVEARERRMLSLIRTLVIA
jgi:hypothetical protein